MVTHQLLTIGYEGKRIDEFVDALKKNHVEKLIDVREMPLSRKPGFSKTKLKMKLDENNIQYIHYKTLGCPKPIRHKLQEDWDYKYFTKAYSEYLNENLKSIEELKEEIYNSISCLMCFEKQHDKCHRSIIVQSILNDKELNLKIHNI